MRRDSKGRLLDEGDDEDDDDPSTSLDPDVIGSAGFVGYGAGGLGDKINVKCAA